MTKHLISVNDSRVGDTPYGMSDLKSGVLTYCTRDLEKMLKNYVTGGEERKIRSDLYINNVVLPGELL